MPSRGRDKKRKKLSSASSPAGPNDEQQHTLNQSTSHNSAAALRNTERSRLTMPLFSSEPNSSGDEEKSIAGDSTEMNVSQKLDFIIEKLNNVEQKLEGKIFDIERRIDDLPTKNDLKTLEDRLDDQANRMRRNNIILHNIPEEAEGKGVYDCASFVKDFIVNHMGLISDSTESERWEIERAHRTPTGPPRQNRTRPIHVKFLRYQDRVLVLKAASTKLKDKPFSPTGSNMSKLVYISDDVTESVRKQRKKLVAMKKKIKEQWPERKCFIPPTVPAVLLRENEEGKLVRVLPDDVVSQ